MISANTEIRLRPAAPDDTPFLYALYCSVRTPEFAPLNLPPDQLEALLRMQYTARTGSYEAQFPDSDNDIVLSGDTPVGQLWVNRTGTEHLVVDISLLPEYRSSGIGSRLMRRLIEEADRRGVPLRCSVATNNPGSLRFHQRLGFQITSQDWMYYQMERSSGG